MDRKSNVRKKVPPQKNRGSKEKSKSKKPRMDSPEAVKKKILSFDTLVEVMRPSIEELEFREEKASESNFVQKYSKLFKCTKCRQSIKPVIVNHEEVPIHPCLGVLMCQKCRDYYEDGEFSLDSDGEDKYCRWCGEGGTLFSCSKCICAFCVSCIKLHFKSEYFKEVQKDKDWLCFFCNPKPLWELRFICSLAAKMSKSSIGGAEKYEDITKSEEIINTGVEKEEKTEAGSPRKRKSLKPKSKNLGESPSEIKDLTSETAKNSQRLSIYTSSSEESDSEIPLKRVKCTSTPIGSLLKKMETGSFEKKKSNDVLRELKKILSLSVHQMEFGVDWSRNMVEKMASPEYTITNTNLVKECQKIKQFLSLLSTFLVQSSNSVESLQRSLYKKDGKVVEHHSAQDQSAYNNILLFLGFIRGQVKAFMEKGISLSDILEAEVYDDDKIIGIKKKSNPSIGTFSQAKSKASASSHSSGSSFRSKCGTQSKENSQQNRIDELDKIRDDDILEVVENQTLEREGFDMVYEHEFKDHDSSNTTLSDLNEIKCAPEPDIRDILAILENA